MFLARVGKFCNDVWRVFDTVFTNFESDLAMVWQCFWHGLTMFLAWFGIVFGMVWQGLCMVWQGFWHGLARFLAWFGNVWLRFYVEEGGGERGPDFRVCVHVTRHYIHLQPSHAAYAYLRDIFHIQFFLKGEYKQPVRMTQF